MRAIVIAAIIGRAALAHAGNGTLVVDVSKADGHAVAADCELRAAGATSLLKRLSAGTGVAQTSLAAGSYDVTCKARLGGLTGTLRVSVTSGKTSRFRITVEAARPVVEAARTSGGSGLSGTVIDAARKPLSGKVEIVLTVDVVDGKFDAGALPPGHYLVRYLGGTASKTVDVAAGKSTRVDLQVAAPRAKLPAATAH